EIVLAEPERDVHRVAAFQAVLYRDLGDSEMGAVLAARPSSALADRLADALVTIAELEGRLAHAEVSGAAMSAQLRGAESAAAAMEAELRAIERRLRDVLVSR